ncbi:hypothetical protein RIF29_21807 [Crotalaria pallida]|uniref:Uncharacterized protein n=1 Tax=Crotalaria pallida TaxID=3830 RepID=A0AAN9F586_CROPI
MASSSSTSTSHRRECPLFGSKPILLISRTIGNPNRLFWRCPRWQEEGTQSVVSREEVEAMVAVSHEEEEVTRLVASRDDDYDEEGTQLVVLQVEVDELAVVSLKVACAPPVEACHHEELLLSEGGERHALFSGAYDGNAVESIFADLVVMPQIKVMAEDVQPLLAEVLDSGMLKERKP